MLFRSVTHFVELEWFRQQAAAAAERIRTGQRAPGIDQVFTPGEPEWRRRQKSGDFVKLDPSVIAMLTRFE